MRYFKCLHTPARGFSVFRVIILPVRLPKTDGFAIVVIQRAAETRRTHLQRDGAQMFQDFPGVFLAMEGVILAKNVDLEVLFGSEGVSPSGIF